MTGVQTCALPIYLTLNIKYYINSDQFEVGGNVNRKGREELVSTFLRGQIGAGKDDSKPNEKDTYNTQLKWYPENDRIEVRSDTGNKGLRDGILVHYLKNLNK